jgi:hypothetical protein
MYKITEKIDNDEYAQASAGALALTTATTIGTKTIIGGAIANGIGHTAIAVKGGFLIASVGAGTCAAPIIAGAALGYLAIKGVVRLFNS